MNIILFLWSQYTTDNFKSPKGKQDQQIPCKIQLPNGIVLGLK
jgi:hypothetical protein